MKLKQSWDKRLLLLPELNMYYYIKQMCTDTYHSPEYR